MAENKILYYLELKDRRGGLLVKVNDSSVYTCTHIFSKAMAFNSKSDAEIFLDENKLTGIFNVLKVEEMGGGSWFKVIKFK